MNVNIYYGGRGLVDDPSIYVMKKLQEVLQELNIKVTKYNLYELKNSVASLPQTLKDADAIILATTVEWYGIGGLMQNFLDACWLYGDKSVIGSLYMFPVVMAKTYGEREATHTLISAWDILGGKTFNGLSAYVEDNAEFEFNLDYVKIIEQKAEEIYRTISQKRKTLPTSNGCLVRNAIKDTVIYTPQESEQLSKYVSDENFVAAQKRDIDELTSKFTTILNDEANGGDDYYTDSLQKAYVPGNKESVAYNFTITDRNKSFYVKVVKGMPEYGKGATDGICVGVKMTKSTFDNIVSGRMTFQRAFMTGEITANGDMKNIKTFDELFRF